MPLRRGFKSEANEIARVTRAELGVGAVDPIDPRQLADCLDVPIEAMSNLRDVAGPAVSYFSGVDSSSFSAVTVFSGSYRMIVHNDSHHPGRQSSNVTHELSHALLLHPPTPAIDDKGCRVWNRDVEDEAEWLSGTLLVPEKATIWVVRDGLTVSEAAELYGVTERLMSFRINLTGARRRVARGEGRYIGFTPR